MSDLLGTPAQSGDSHLAMDVSVSGPFNLNEAILTLDLSNHTQADLEFSHKSVGDETNPLPAVFSGSFNGDGVSISDDGNTWHTLVSLNSANSPNGVYTTFQFDLDSQAAAAGIALGSNFQIKFQQYDNFGFNSDGRAFDDILVTTPGPLSDATAVYLESDQTLTLAARPLDDSATLTATVRDPNNAVIANVTAAGPGETLEIQSLGVPIEGDYGVEITADVAADYDLALYRNASVEVFDNADGLEQDASGSFINLGSGRFGILGQFDTDEATGRTPAAEPATIDPAATVGSESPASTPDLYGDPGEPGRFPEGTNAPVQQSPNELLINGSFETGDFTGWSTATTASPFRPWAVDTAATGGGFGMLQTQPQDGAYVAWNGFDGNGPMQFHLYQDVTIPSDSDATLHWMDRVQWNFTLGGTVTTPRLYDVELHDPVTGTVLETLYSFSTGTQATDPTGNTNWQTHAVDVSAYAGDTVRIFFREQVPQSGTGPAQIEIDGVSLAVDPGGSAETLYAGVARGSTLNPGGVLIVDQNTGAGTLLADPITPGGITGLDFDGSGRLWASKIDGPQGNRTSELVQLDPDTGSLLSAIPITRNGVPISIGDLAIQPGTDLVFGTHSNADSTSFPNGELYTIDRSTGVASLVGNTQQNRSGGIGFAPDGTLYLAEFNQLHTLSLSTGAPLTTISTSFDGHEGLAVRPSDGMLFTSQARAADGNQAIWTIDPVTGISTLVGQTGVGGPSDLAFRVLDPTPADEDEYRLDLTGKSGDSIDIAMSFDPSIAGELSTDDIVLELLDIDGSTVLASGSMGAENYDIGIAGFLVPADGVYTLRVASELSGRYGIVITDQLVFDTESNQPTNSSLRSLDAYQGGLGFLSERQLGGDVDLGLINAFESLQFATDSGYIPPDPIIAAGPTSVVTMVNTDIAIHDKVTGAYLAKADLDGGGGFWPTNDAVFDPWVAFDPGSNRFYAIGIDRIRSGPTRGSSRMYLAVSTDANPTNLTTDWNKYVLDRTGTHQNTGGPTFPDYPKLGFDGDAIYITGNEFGIDGGGLSHVSLFAIEKTPLLSGGPINILYDEVISGSFAIHPVNNYDPGSPMRFAEATGNNAIRLHTLSGVLTGGTRTTQSVSVPIFLFPTDVPQPGGAPLDSVSQRIMSGVVRDGSLWTGHAIQDPAVDNETVMRWYQFDVSGPVPSLVQHGNVDPGPGLHTWMGHVNVDADGDMGIAFSMAGPTQFASIGYTGRLATDPLGTTRPVETARSGEAAYNRFDGIGRNRWGDYSGLAIDPDGETFWLYNEYATAGDNWNTFVGSFQVEAGVGTDRDVDTYQITLSSGQPIQLATRTPYDSPVDGLNQLDPSLEILDPHGNSVAFDSNSAADGKNARIDTFTAVTSGVYQVIVASETDGNGEYVLDVNWAPQQGATFLSANEIFEHESISLVGSYQDRDLDDSHSVVIDWDDPNAANSTFAVPAIHSLSIGDTFASSSDDAQLQITALDHAIGSVHYTVTEHQYLDDGTAPGNATTEDTSTVSVTVTDLGGLVADTIDSQLIVNGDFETGDFSGWTVTSTGGGNWLINDGTLVPPGPATELPPIEGAFDAISTQNGPGVNILSEPILVPNSVTSATLSWSDRIRNYATAGFVEPGQEWRALVMDTSGNLIQEVYSTQPGDPLSQLEPNNRSFDLTSLLQTLTGQTIQISFQQQDSLGYMNVSLDNVQLHVSSSPSVRIKNIAPMLRVDPAESISENSAAVLSGTLTDLGSLDEHRLSINWGDPNQTDVATFLIPAAASLSVGDTLSSVSESDVLSVTGIDLTTGELRFDVRHVYADDGLAPGNGTPWDVYTINASVTDDDSPSLPSHLISFRDPINLGQAINTNLNDGGPTLSADGRQMYFHANRPDGSGALDLYVATREQLTDPFAAPSNLGPAINSPSLETAPSLSQDGLSLYFSSNRPGGEGFYDLYVSHRASIDDSFGAPINLSSGVNSGLSEFAPAISADGLTLFFQRRNDPSGFGGDDLWMATRPSTTEMFGSAVNLGSAINTQAFEGGPVLTADSLALYFSSNRPGGSGQLDLYVSTRTTIDDAFGTPTVLTVPVNSTLLEFNAEPGPDGLYFHSNRPGGEGQIDLWFAGYAGQTTVRVNNLAPEIESLSVSAVESNKATVAENVVVSATFRDAGRLDRHQVAIGWDDTSNPSVFDLDATADLSAGDTFVAIDGAVLTITNVDALSGSVGFEVTHQFATGGIFELSMMISDDDSGTAEANAQAWVTGLRVNNGVLQIIGSNTHDQVSIDQTEDGMLKVHASFLASGNFETFDVSTVEKIIGYLCEGDDHFTMAGNIAIPTVVHGGGGDDHLKGGRASVLLGDDGDDTLIGGSGQDLLIGGTGSDRLVGSSGNDVLVGGSSNLDDDEDDALFNLLAEWISDASYQDRVQTIDELLTVDDDNQSDKLTGSSGEDLFFDGLGDQLTDVKTKKSVEVVL
ncbi:pre-peptidase C-terminal domain-containing protein [Stieleria tagensis]|uniref:pre-peptidase C-terminal domain-containing protein n=1 Tax=Stieleria tagensis TaxID=2956795 RepID=UPI00209A7E62|nr:pre-peptidase C-terminal domain-containing protein [Stieleria tagensis]